VMSQLGFETFFVAGHDRGGRVAHRMALDHPRAREKLAVLDIVPTLRVVSRLDARVRDGLLLVVLPRFSRRRCRRR
jgi:haloacetate dehalogenase